MRGAFHSTKTFENLETASNGTEISWKCFQKFRKLLNFQNANHSTENFRNSGSKIEWKENFLEIFFRKFGYTSRGQSSFLEMSENRHYWCSQPKNAVPFPTGSCRKFKPELLVEWKAPTVYSTESTEYAFFWEIFGGKSYAAANILVLRSPPPWVFRFQIKERSFRN